MRMLIIISLALLTLSTFPNQKLLNQGKTALYEKNEHVARSCLKQIIDNNPNHPDALFTLSIVEFYANNYDLSGSYLKRALALAPHNELLMQTAAIIFGHIGEFDYAIELFEKLYSKNPTNETVTSKLFPLYIRNMDWDNAYKFCFINDLWWYNEDISNSSVLLDLSDHSNGLGDVLQIIRYAQHLYNAGARVTVLVRKELIPLLSNCPYIATLLPIGTEKPITDHTYRLTTDHCMLRMADQMQSPSGDVPYIFATTKNIQRWAPFFKNKSKLNIGICFQSSKMRDYFSDKTVPGPRAFTPDLLKPLLAIKDIQFYSLQMGEDAAIQQLKNQGYNLITFGAFDTNGAFTDTAAIMRNLDLVITVDTSIAHLAGALGVPTWVMLPYCGDFRWFRDRSDTPLYPTMRLFRQQKQGDWQPLIARVADALEALINPI